MKYILLAFFLSACASAPKPRLPIVAHAEYGVLTSSSADVIVVPQWHLSPQTNTQVSSANLPQAENQRAIYRQLVDWTENGVIQTVIVEGCEGEIDDSFHERFNGWTLEDLQKLSAEALDNTMTHVGLKLKAREGRKLKVLCGDLNELVKKHQLILSDLRGFLGFKIRIEEFANDIQKRADYVATVRDLMKMPQDSDEIDILSTLDDQLKDRMRQFNDVLHQRNAAFIARAKAATSPGAIVIGAIHVEDLQKQLGEAQLLAATFTPKGLRGDEAELIGEIQALLERTSPKRPAKLNPKSSSGSASEAPR